MPKRPQEITQGLMRCSPWGSLEIGSAQRQRWCLRKLELRKLESSDKEKKENRDNNKIKHLALLKKEKEKNKYKIGQHDNPIKYAGDVSSMNDLNA